MAGRTCACLAHLHDNLYVEHQRTWDIGTCAKAKAAKCFPAVMCSVSQPSSCPLASVLAWHSIHIR